jgi:hypothetical protein
MNIDEITNLFLKQIKKVKNEVLKTTITDTKHEWLHCIAPDTIISSEIHKIECQPLIDTMSKFELILPLYQAKKLNLKKLSIDTAIVYYHEQQMDEYDQVKVNIPFTGGAEGCREAYLRVWVASSIANKLQCNEEQNLINNEKKMNFLNSEANINNNEKRKFVEVYTTTTTTVGAASNNNHMIKSSSVINDTSSTTNDKNEVEKIKKIENIVDSSSSEVFQSTEIKNEESGYILVSPIEITREEITTAENFIVIGYPGLVRLNLKADPVNKKLVAVKKRKMFI